MLVAAGCDCVPAAPAVVILSFGGGLVDVNALGTITDVAICKFAHLHIIKDFSLFVAVEAEARHDPQQTGK